LYFISYSYLFFIDQQFIHFPKSEFFFHSQFRFSEKISSISKIESLKSLLS
ncbi:unnamed protein product, partial [Brassica rapa subsp. trilocularis]